MAAPYGNTPCMASAKGGKKFPGGALSTGCPAFPRAVRTVAAAHPADSAVSIGRRLLFAGFSAATTCAATIWNAAIVRTSLDLATIPVVLTTESRTSSNSVVIEAERPAGYCDRILSLLRFALRAQTRARQASTAARGELNHRRRTVLCNASC